MILHKEGSLTPEDRAQGADRPSGGQDAARHTIANVLASLQHSVGQAPAGEKIALRDVFSALEQNSFPVLLLVFSLLLVSPLSAIPGATTVFGLTIASILAQLLLGRKHAWLPDILMRQRLPVQQTQAALQWLEKPVAWLDRGLRHRLSWVTAAPTALAPKAVVLCAALCTPLMEVIPASGTSVGAAITLFSASLLARDGMLVLVGAGLAALMPLALWMLLT